MAPDEFAALPGFYRLVFLYIEPSQSNFSQLRSMSKANTASTSVYLYSRHIRMDCARRELVLPRTDSDPCTSSHIVG